MQQLKKGDTVRLVSIENTEKDFAHIKGVMKCVGDIGVISEIFTDSVIFCGDDYNFFYHINDLQLIEDEKLPKFRNNNSGKLYTIFMITNVNSEREDFPETYVYFDEDQNWWSRPAKDFLEKNTRVDD